MTTSNTIGNPTPPPVSPPPQPPQTPPASLGTLTDSEQRVWNTLVGDVGADAAAQAVINTRALNAGTAAINSGSASTVTVTPAGEVTTVTPSGDKNTGQATATDTGVDTTVKLPPVLPTGFTSTGNAINDIDSLFSTGASLQQIQAYMSINNVDLNQLSGSQQSQLTKIGYTQPGGDSYEFDSPDKSIGTVYVPVSQWDNWTPAQQLAFQIKLKLTPSDAVLVTNKDGSWGYTSKSEATSADAKQQANSGMTNGIPTDLYNTYLANKDRYAAAGKPPPLNFDHTVDGQVTVTPYADPSKAVTYSVPTGTQLFFNNVKGMPVIDKLTDLKGNTIIKANSDGTFNTDDVYTAFKSGTLSKTAAISLVGGTAFNQAQVNAGIMSILNNSKNGLTDGKGNYDLSKALSQKNVTQADLLEVGFTQDEINAALKPSKVTPISPANKLLGGSSPNYPSSYSQDDWDKDIASGKIAAGSVFGSYDPKTGLVSYTSAADAAASNAVMTEINTTLASKKPNLGNVDALNTAIEDAGLWNNSALNAKRDLQTGLLYDAKTKQVLTQQDQVNLVWKTLTPDQQATVAAAYSQDLYRTNPFAETTKNIAIAGEQGGILGQMAVAPLTGITLPIAKVTSGQKVSAQDIEGAVITAVGDILMVGGGFEAITTTTNAAGQVVASSVAPAVKVITSSLLTGMGAVGVVDTVMQAKAGKTAGSTLAVEAALSVAALVGGAGGLVSSIVPKETPDIDVAQQFVNKMKSQTTPEGLAKNSPFQAPSNISGDTELGEPDIETATHQADVTASYKEWTQAATEYAQNQHDINDLTAKIADNRTTLDAITKGSTIPDEYTAKLASDTAKMDSMLTKLRAAEDDLAAKVNDTGDQFSTSLKAYNTYAKGNGLVFNDNPDEMIKNLPKDSAATIKATVNQLMNGDDSPAAIARQQEVVDNLQRQYDQFKGKTGQSADIGADLANEQSKLNLMKVGNLTTGAI